MLKKLFYYTLRNVCRLATSMYFRGIEINGKERIPDQGSIIYAPNHQNAFLDAILIGIFSPRPVSFFTRRDIFTPPFLWFLDALNMLPVYRAKDGFSKVTENVNTFDLSVTNLLKGKPLMIFPEANHDYPYILRTLSKGTARVAMDAQLKSKKPVYIIPVGLNYFRRHVPRFKLVVNYGEPINMEDYISEYKDHKGRALTAIRDKMTQVLKEEMVIPNYDERYEARAKVFTRFNERLNFGELKVKARNLSFEKERIYPWLRPIILALSLPNFIPLVLSHYVVSLFNDQVFPGSMKFGIAALFCPVWYLFCLFVLSLLFGFFISLSIVVAMILFLFIRQELVRYVSITEHSYITKW